MPKFLARIRRPVTFAIALLNVFTIVALRPVILIRLQRMNVSRIGHFLPEMEITLAMQRLGYLQKPKRAVDVWLLDGKVCNHQILKMRRRSHAVARIPAGQTTVALLCKSAIGRGHIVNLNSSQVDYHGVLAQTQPTLSLSSEEIQNARVQAQNLGLNEGRPWICIANRDSAYLRHADRSVDRSYHDFRNSDIKNYVLAANALAELGYYVVRMGRVVAEELPCRHERVIDYATSGLTSDLLDVYLGFGCAFFLSTGTGAEDFAGVARRPRAYVNFVAVGGVRSEEPNSIHIFKTHCDIDTGAPLPQTALRERGVHAAASSREFSDANVMLFENSPTEIKDVALDMERLLHSGLRLSKADHRRQALFWCYFEQRASRAPGVAIRTLIGLNFLKNNPQWMA